MQYYAVGQKTVKTKEGSTTVPVVIRGLPDKRVRAEQEVQSCCRREGIRFEGMYLVKQADTYGGIMTKGIKKQKADKHKKQVDAHRRLRLASSHL